MTSIPALQLIMDKLGALIGERDEHLRSAELINEQIAAVAKQLGLDPGEVVGSPRLPTEHKPSDRTMSSAIIDILYRADKGFSRTALRDELMATERFRDQINKNVNSYYNNVSRYKKQGKIVEINSLLYHPDRAPLPDGDPDPLGLHLPADNVSSLFGPVKRSIDV